jgi:1-deoxy-D-xylulose-5-phosphate reductoisomerase
LALELTDDGVMEFLAEPERLKLAVLGSTGSIGRQTLDVAREYPHRFEVVALAAGTDADCLLTQAKEFEVELLGLVDGDVEVAEGVRLFRGERSAEEVVQECDAHIVVNAVVGSNGLRATMATIAAGKMLALANKESLVAGGELVMSKVMEGQLRPIDSEHSALWQLLDGIPPDQVRRVLLTGSGGPFRGRTAEELRQVTVGEALRHPVWEMGPKITVDSSTLMNKGLEVIEAHFLFGLTYDEIQVVIHPQGMVHGMVQTKDGCVFAHAALPDMRLPIQLALSWPDRLGAAAGIIDWAVPQSMTFEPADTATFRCLALAYEAGRLGGTYPAVLNAANEAAVDAFIKQQLDFLGIAQIVETVVDEHSVCEPNLDSILEQDAWAKRRARELIRGRSR